MKRLALPILLAAALPAVGSHITATMNASLDWGAGKIRVDDTMALYGENAPSGDTGHF